MMSDKWKFRTLIGACVVALVGLVAGASAYAAEPVFTRSDEGIVFRDTDAHIRQDYGADFIVGMPCLAKAGGRVAFEAQSGEEVMVTYHHPLGQIQKSRDCPGSAGEPAHISFAVKYFEGMRDFFLEQQAFETTQ